MGAISPGIGTGVKEAKATGPAPSVSHNGPLATLQVHTYMGGGSEQPATPYRKLNSEPKYY